MIILVNDANIFIDLLGIDLLESFLQLQYEFHDHDGLTQFDKSDRKFIAITRKGDK